MAGVEISAPTRHSGPDSQLTSPAWSSSRARTASHAQDIQVSWKRSPRLPSDANPARRAAEFMRRAGGIDDPPAARHAPGSDGPPVTRNLTRRARPLCVNGRGRVGDGLRAARHANILTRRARARLAASTSAPAPEYALFAEGEIQYSAVAPIGAGHFTNDLAMVLRTPFAEAERIKVKQGCCLPSMVTEEEGIAVPTVAGGTSRVVPKRELCEILQPRAEELFNLIREDFLKHASDEELRGGLVLTGGARWRWGARRADLRRGRRYGPRGLRTGEVTARRGAARASPLSLGARQPASSNRSERDSACAAEGAERKVSDLL